MVTLTAPAKAQLDSYFEQNVKSAIRIFLTSSSCAGPRLTLALDDAKDGDSVHNVDGYDFVVDNELYAEAKPLTVDFSCSGFQVESSLKLSGGGCSCSGGSCS
ncbi:IscA/HesB family protein [Fundidesulfovibrio agrisoli]|uniref:IscA/HesB family protein n=1 Tax=Fundidesulfovibrio agrisoli TaxID=2922717 RepID=UPI001FAB8336|nr:IscA/HesB family protein [Fundidesulfovibrio agrisoli]